MQLLLIDCKTLSLSAMQERVIKRIVYFDCFERAVAGVDENEDHLSSIFYLETDLRPL